MSQGERAESPALDVTSYPPNPRTPWLARYLAQLTAPRLVLWCYLIWYLFVLVRYFDASARLWLSSLGISGIVGTGLYLSTVHGGATRTPLERWQVVRLYMMPFCVSSFAALIKGRGFVLVFDPSWTADAAAVAGCSAFLGASLLARRLWGGPTPSDALPAWRPQAP